MSIRSSAETLIYLSTITLLGASAAIYLLARHGELVRSRRHRRAPRGLIDSAMKQRGSRTLTMLVPAYREDARIIRQTLLSAALQEYPRKRLVLLIDDPASPESAEHARLLAEARAVPAEIAALLAEPADHFQRALAFFEETRECDPAAVLDCAGRYRLASSYIDSMMTDLDIVDHTDVFLRDEVLGGLKSDLDVAAAALARAGQDGHDLPEDVLHQLYRRLAWTFACEVTSFERKQFANLSHEANKAMNLNSYLGLMGGSYKIEGHHQALALSRCDPDRADLVVPDTDYVLTLDADSVLLPEYCLRLTYRMELPTFSDVAVIQTPYSAYPRASSRLERIAGATTDIQHILHQGMTYFDATFWVGANAILRRSALDDIVQVDTSGPWPVKRYVSDRTVIEDTESSVDLVASGWRLHNYNERLSYSATPPDFGSLCVQRQRWANGGLLILPKLLKSIRRGADPIGSLIRVSYVASIAWASVGLLLMLAWPFDDRFLSPLVLAIAGPYFVAMSFDLKRCGYKRSDVVRVYAFNLIMLPVNLAGTIKSLYQAMSGRKYAFARTPKIKDRTTSGFWFAFFPYLLIGWASYTVYRDLQVDSYVHAVFAGMNAVLGLYGLIVFVGVRASLMDMAVRSFELLRRDERVTHDDDSVEMWEEVLFYGNVGSEESQTVRMPARLALAEPENFAAPEERVPMATNLYGDSGDQEQGGVVIDLTERPRDHDLLEAIRTSKALLEAIEQRLDDPPNVGPNERESTTSLGVG